jgi:hypothetical protein
VAQEVTEDLPRCRRRALHASARQFLPPRNGPRSKSKAAAAPAPRHCGDRARDREVGRRRPVTLRAWAACPSASRRICSRTPGSVCTRGGSKMTHRSLGFSATDRCRAS